MILRPPLNSTFWDLYQDSSEVFFADLLVIATEGSTYQKAGSRMIISQDGQQWGMIGGGCFDHQLRSAAVEVITTQAPKIISVDTRSSDDLIFGSGLGCHGLVEIYIRPISAGQSVDNLNDFLGLSFREEGITIKHIFGTRTIEEKRSPTPRLIVFGCGDDTPQIFRNLFFLGWHGIAVDPRQPSAFVQSKFEKLGVTYASQHPEQFLKAFIPRKYDACLIMSHRLDLDIEAFHHAAEAGFFYVGLLGPPKRRETIFREYRSRRQLSGATQIPNHIFAPCGLALGGSGPEAIALAVAAELQLLWSAGSTSHMTKR